MMPSVADEFQISAALPQIPGYYWIRCSAIKEGQATVVKVDIDEFARVSVRACGVGVEFSEDQLFGAQWSRRIMPPLGLVDLPFLDGIPF
jgi:hypothetical protein